MILQERETIEISSDSKIYSHSDLKSWLMQLIAEETVIDLPEKANKKGVPLGLLKSLSPEVDGGQFLARENKLFSPKQLRALLKEEVTKKNILDLTSITTRFDFPQNKLFDICAQDPEMMLYKDRQVVNLTWLSQLTLKTIETDGKIYLADFARESEIKGLKKLKIENLSQIIEIDKSHGILTADKLLFLTAAYLQQQLLDKVKLFTEISFQEIAESLNIKVHYVEEILQEGIRQNIVNGKINRRDKSFVVRDTDEMVKPVSVPTPSSKVWIEPAEVRGGRSTTTELHSLKVFVVGEPAVGKTALYYAISENKPPSRLSSTTGIDTFSVLSKKEDSIEWAISWWDFAGQYAYRDIQKLFFTEEAVYILVLNLRDSLEKNRAGYWLESIRDKAPNALILPVLTHLDEVKGGVLGLTAAEDWVKLKQLLQTYRAGDPIKVSNVDGTNIPKVKLFLEKSLRKTVGIEVPPIYFDLLNYVKENQHRIFLPKLDLLEELKEHFYSHTDYSFSKLHQMIDFLSNNAELQLLELISTPDLVLLDVDLVNKAMSNIMDHAKRKNGIIQEIDMLDVAADFFDHEYRRDAAEILMELIISIDLGIPFEEKSSMGLITRNILVPHAAEVLSDDQALTYLKTTVFDPFLEKDIRKFALRLTSYDELISARLLGHLLNFVDFTKQSRIWRQDPRNTGRPTQLHAVLFVGDEPSLYFVMDRIESNVIHLNISTQQTSLAEGVFSTITHALAKYKVDYGIEKLFTADQMLQQRYSLQRTESEKIKEFVARITEIQHIPERLREELCAAVKRSELDPLSSIITSAKSLELLLKQLYEQKTSEDSSSLTFGKVTFLLSEKGIIPEHEKVWINTVRIHRNKCAHSAFSRPKITDAHLIIASVIHIFEWYAHSDFSGDYVVEEELLPELSREHVDGVPSEPPKQRAFFCQLDNEQHPATDSAYQCDQCSRMICANCYDQANAVGMKECPYCQGVLKEIQ